MNAADRLHEIAAEGSTPRLVEAGIRALVANLLVPRSAGEVAAFLDATGLGHQEIVTGSLAVIRAGGG